MLGKIRTNKDFQLYLKILAEESVRKAYRNEMSTSMLREKGEDEDDIFAAMDAEDEEGGQDSGGEAADTGAGEGGKEQSMSGGDEPAKGQSADADMGMDASEPEQKQEPKQAVRPTPLTLELGSVTADGMISTLNMIRGGRSFKEADISAELRKYFEKELNDSERLALATFLSAIRDISTGETADEAPSPGDENVKIDAQEKQKQDQQQNTAPQQPQQQQPAPQQQPVQQTQRVAPRRTGGIEDTTPPIQVGPRRESKNDEFRARIRALLG